MYTLQSAIKYKEIRYRWLYTDSHGTVYACGISDVLKLNPSHNPGMHYRDVTRAHEAYPHFTTILTTDNPSSLPETHPELFI